MQKVICDRTIVDGYFFFVNSLHQQKEGEEGKTKVTESADGPEWVVKK